MLQTLVNLGRNFWKINNRSNVYQTPPVPSLICVVLTAWTGYLLQPLGGLGQLFVTRANVQYSGEQPQLRVSGKP